MGKLLSGIAKTFGPSLRESFARSIQKEQFDARQEFAAEKEETRKAEKEKQFGLDTQKEQRLTKKFQAEQAEKRRKLADQKIQQGSIEDLLTNTRETTQNEKDVFGGVAAIAGVPGETPTEVPLNAEEKTARLLTLDKNNLKKYTDIQEIINPEPQFESITTQRGAKNKRPTVVKLRRDKNSGEIIREEFDLGFDPKEETDKSGKALEKLKTSFERTSSEINRVVDVPDSMLDPLRAQIDPVDLEILDSGDTQAIRQVLTGTGIENIESDDIGAFINAIDNLDASKKALPEIKYLNAKAKIKQNQENLDVLIQSRFFTPESKVIDSKIKWENQTKATEQLQGVVDKFVNQELKNVSEKDLMGLALKYRNRYGDIPVWQMAFLIQ